MSADQQAEAAATGSSLQYARSLGVDPECEPDLFAFVNVLMKMPIPAPWKECKDPKQRVFYWNPISRRSSWAHPLSTSHSTLVAAYRRITCASDRAAATQAEINSRHAQAEAELALWHEVPGSEGGPFFYHAKTKATRWDNPREEVESRLHIEAQLLAKLAEADLDVSPNSVTNDSVAAAVAAAASPLVTSPGATVSVLAAAYTSEDLEDAELSLHPILKELRSIFERCDVRGEGRMSKLALATVCQHGPEVCDFFRLPREIAPDDGSRNALEWFFHLLGLGGDPEIDWEDFQTFYAQRLLEIRAYGDTTVEEEQLLNDPRWSPNAALNGGGFASCAGHTAAMEDQDMQREQADMWATLRSRVEAAAAAAAAESSTVEEQPPKSVARSPVGKSQVRSDLAILPPGVLRPSLVASQRAASPAAGECRTATEENRSAAASVVQRTWRCNRSKKVAVKPPDFEQDTQCPVDVAAGPLPSPSQPAREAAASQAAAQRHQPVQTCCLEADDFASTMLVGLFPVRSSPSSSPSKRPPATAVRSPRPLSEKNEPAAEAASTLRPAPGEDATGSDAEFEDDFESDDEVGSAAEDQESQAAGKNNVEEVDWQDLMEESSRQGSKSSERRPDSTTSAEAGDRDTGGTNTQPEDLPVADAGAPSAPVMDLLAALPQEVLSPVPAGNAPITVPWPLGLEPEAPQEHTDLQPAAPTIAEIDAGAAGRESDGSTDARNALENTRFSSASPSAAVVEDELDCNMDLNIQTLASASGASVTAAVMVADRRRCDGKLETQISQGTESGLDNCRDGKVKDRASVVRTKSAAPRESIDAFLSSLAVATAALDKTWSPRLLRVETLAEEREPPHPQIFGAVPRTRPLSRPHSLRHQGSCSAAIASKRRQRGPAKSSATESVARCASETADEEADEGYSDDDFEEESSEGEGTACSPLASPAAAGRSARSTRQSTLANLPMERPAPQGARRAVETFAPGRQAVKVHKAYSHDARKAYMRALELLPQPAPASARHRPAPEPPPRGRSTPALRPVRGKVGVRGSRGTRGGHSNAVPGGLAYSLRQATTASIVKSCPNLPSRPRMP